MATRQESSDIVKQIVGGIEAGGTKFVCAIGTGPDDVLATGQFDTTLPDTTIGACVDWFRHQQEKHGQIAAVGVAAFGPLDRRRGSSTYGNITSTPKPGWRDTPLKMLLEDALNVPIAVDTDVNGAALGESLWGAAQGLDTFVYLTIGTGIGGGAMVDHKLVHGMLHPEMGHFRLPHDRDRDPFPGRCPYHGDCFEGLASGSAIRQRWGMAGEDLPADHPAWALESHYVAQALMAIVAIISPQRIVLGGGVMKQDQLFPLIRAELVELLSGYIQSTEILENADQYVVPPGLGDRAGVLGALALGLEAVQ
jgi:fructokinase